MPYGFGSVESGGEKRGVMAAAAIVFFAFYGFDAVATSAEEAKNPKRDLTIGIISSMLVCTLIYMGVAITAVRSEEHTSELQSLMRISYAVFCLNKKKITRQ